MSIALIATLVGAYALAGFWWAPRYIRAEFARFVTEDLRKIPAIGEVKINPFTLSGSIAALSIPEPSGERIVGFERLAIDLSIASIWKRGPVFEDITLDKPYVAAVIRNDRSINLAGLVPPDDPQAKPEADTEGLPIYIARSTMQGGEVRFEDRSRQRLARARLKPVSLTLTDFSTRVGSGNAYIVNAVSQAGERLRWDGRFGLKPFTAQGRFSVTQLRASTVDDMLHDSLPVVLQSGTIGLGGRYDLTAATTPLSGRITLDTLDVAQLAMAAIGRTQPDVIVGRLSLRGASVDLGAQRVDLGRIEVRDTQVRAWLDASGLSLDALSGPPAAESSPAPASTESPWTSMLPVLAVEQARLDFEDRRLALPARITVAPISLTARGWSTQPESKVDFESTLGINGKARFEAKGTLESATLETRAKLRSAARVLTGAFGHRPDRQFRAPEARDEAVADDLQACKEKRPSRRNCPQACATRGDMSMPKWLTGNTNRSRAPSSCVSDTATVPSLGSSKRANHRPSPIGRVPAMVPTSRLTGATRRRGEPSASAAEGPINH